MKLNFIYTAYYSTNRPAIALYDTNLKWKDKIIKTIRNLNKSWKGIVELVFGQIVRKKKPPLSTTIQKIAHAKRHRFSMITPNITYTVLLRTQWHSQAM